jgi:hypothetical protein
MAKVTYDDALSTDKDRVRFYIQDVSAGAGPKPSDANFSDDEIAGLVTVEGSWQRAVAGAFEALEAAWRRYPNFSTDGLSVSRSDIANGYADKAAAWRKAYGNTGSTATASTRAGSRAVTRQDAYSSDKDNVTA